MRQIRNRSSNQLRRELLRGINDYLDEIDDAGGGPERIVISGPGGCRTRFAPASVGQDIAVAGDFRRPTPLAYGC